MKDGLKDTEKIKLLILIPTLECGGSEKYISLLCNHIDTQKFAVTLVVLNNEHPFYTINNTSVTVISLKTKQVRHSFFKLRHIIKTVEPGIIYTAANHLNLFFAIFKYLLAGKATVVARESSIVSINSKRAKHPVIYNWLIKHFYKRIDCIVCQSAYMQQDLINKYNIQNDRTVIINNAVEQSDIISNNPKQNKFITVARLSKEKGIDRLIRAVAKLSIPFSYHIIGNGDEMKNLEKLIWELDLQNKVFLEGQKEDPFKGMEDAGFFLMGSHYEGFPNTLLEAGSLGIPVIAFNAPGGISEIITDGENGLLVTDNTESAFAAAIERAAAVNFNQYQIKTHTQNRFSAMQIVKTTEDLFTQLYQRSKM
jgi:glycosyltransferase involved in cell wall biosynthesis